MKNIDKTRNYFVEEIEQNELISSKHKKVCTGLIYFKHLLILILITRGISISTFASLVGITKGIASSAATIEIYPITAGIKMYKSIIKKKKKKHNKIALLAKTKLNSVKVFKSLRRFKSL